MNRVRYQLRRSDKNEAKQDAAHGFPLKAIQTEESVDEISTFTHDNWKSTAQ